MNYMTKDRPKNKSKINQGFSSFNVKLCLVSSDSCIPYRIVNGILFCLPGWHCLNLKITVICFSGKSWTSRQMNNSLMTCKYILLILNQIHSNMEESKIKWFGKYYSYTLMKIRYSATIKYQSFAESTELLHEILQFCVSANWEDLHVWQGKPFINLILYTYISIFDTQHLYLQSIFNF